MPQGCAHLELQPPSKLYSNPKPGPGGLFPHPFSSSLKGGRRVALCQECGKQGLECQGINRHAHKAPRAATGSPGMGEKGTRWRARGLLLYSALGSLNTWGGSDKLFDIGQVT